MIRLINLLLMSTGGREVLSALSENLPNFLTIISLNDLIAMKGSPELLISTRNLKRSPRRNSWRKRGTTQPTSCSRRRRSVEAIDCSRTTLETSETTWSLVSMGLPNLKTKIWVSLWSTVDSQLNSLMIMIRRGMLHLASSSSKTLRWISS